MKMKNIMGLSFACLLCSTTITYAETSATEPQAESKGLISPYGDNPNIFHVFMYKSQGQVIRAGKATSRGFAKIGETFDRTFSGNDTETSNKPVIENRSLSDSSSLNNTTPNNQSNHTATSDSVNTYPIEEL